MKRKTAPEAAAGPGAGNRRNSRDGVKAWHQTQGRHRLVTDGVQGCSLRGGLFGDAVNSASGPAPLGDDGEAELPLQCSGQRTAHGVGLPAEGLGDFRDAGPLAALQHGNETGLFRLAAGLGSWPGCGGFPRLPGVGPGNVLSLASCGLWGLLCANTCGFGPAAIKSGIGKRGRNERHAMPIGIIAPDGIAAHDIGFNLLTESLGEEAADHGRARPGDGARHHGVGL